MSGQVQQVDAESGRHAATTSRRTTSALSVRAMIRAGALASVSTALHEADAEIKAGRSSLARLEGVHFARWTVVPGDSSITGDSIGDSLLYTADLDVPADDHLQQLDDRAGELLDAVFAHCCGYPDQPSNGSRLVWLRDHRIRNAASYVNVPGVTVAQIGLESRLHRFLEHHLDEHDELRACRPAEIHRRLRAAVAADPTVVDALRAAAPEPARARARRWGTVVGAAIVVLALLPLVIIVGGIGLLAIRRLERRDVPDNARPDLDLVRRLRSREDEFAFNPFGALGVVKGGWLRATTVKIVLLGIALVASSVFIRGSLAGVTTIHAARWIPLDEGRRMIFTSCYDGSLESYMNDFIDKLAWGLNVIFSNGVGYPRTRWLIFGGAHDEQTFKDYLRRHQLETAVSYASHPSLTAADIRRNVALRRGLSTRTLDDRRAASWLALL